ncbi:class I SAM-dependent methyltransferase [Pseudomonas protegens]|uniref:class I SAM-dependent methyltransferase n=1 Tax=Pseudomonas protegens TaxID=380021 RepID=UPI002759FF2F|nr:methyltransferase domain-containing protein [Pseudomonas protegens]MDP9530032.1 hypothetical protein [Pseudomonas protegens]
MNFRLPEGYYSREPELDYVDGISNVVYQPLIYRAAEKILKYDCAIKYVIDIGCGNAVKLKSLSKRVKLILVDHEKILDIARSNVVSEHAYAINLESDVPDIPDSILEESLIIFSDVVEHIKDPTNILKWLSEKSRVAPCVIISTPDRTMERGLLDFGPPANIFHIREWNLDEFSRVLRDFDFPDKIISGYTIDNTLQKNKNTIFFISGKRLIVPAALGEQIKVHRIEAGSKVLIGDVANSLPQSLIQELEKTDSDWILLESQFGRLSAVPVSKTVDEQIYQADTNGFDAVAAIEVLIEFPKEFEVIYLNKEKPWCGTFDVPKKDSQLFLAAIKKESLVKILKTSSAEKDLKVYPYTLVGFNFNEKSTVVGRKDGFFKRVINSYKASVLPIDASHISGAKQDYWHENRSRLEYALELTLQLDIN